MSATRRCRLRLARGEERPDGSALKRSILRNAGLHSSGQVAALLLSAVTTVVTARYLGASGRGTFAATTSAAGILAVVLLIGSAMAIPSFVARGLLSVRSSLGVAAILMALGVPAVLLVHWTVGAALRLPTGLTGGVVLVLAVSGLMISASQSAGASGAGRLGASAANALVTGATTTAAVLLLLPTMEPSRRLVAALIAWGLGHWLGDAVGWAMLLRRDTVKLSARLPVRSFMRFAAAAYPGTVVGQLAFRLDIVVLPLLANRAEAGVYSIAVVVGSLVALAPSALAQAMIRPLGDMSWATSLRLTRRAVMAGLGVAAGTGLLCLLMLWVLAVPLLGADFSEAPYVFAILLPGVVVFAPVHILVSYANTSLVRPDLPSWIAALVMVVDLGALWFLAPVYGAAGAALASSLSYAIGAGAMLALVRRAVRTFRAG